ncbi:MAG: alpha/beta hydrolase [bacterium]|nr:alpha/beta hydrolase [bacterium]
MQQTIILTKRGAGASGLRFTADMRKSAGPSVLFIHGFPDTFHSFRGQSAALHAAGFQTIAPMLRGYEPSSQHPTNDYHADSLAEDLRDWLDDLGIERAHLIGHDWGAIVAYAAASRFPERVRSLSLLAVPGIREYLKCLVRYPGQFRRSWYMFLFQLPLIARRRLAADDLALIDRLWAEWSPGWFDEMHPEQRAERLAEVKTAFRRPGVVNAAIAYYRAIFDFYTPAGLRGFRTLLGKIQAPTLAITGANDGCLDTRMFDRMTASRAYSGGLRVERLRNAGHWLHLEQPAAVNRLLLEFLQSLD